jgi:hypothetical protein
MLEPYCAGASINPYDFAAQIEALLRQRFFCLAGSQSEDHT